METSLDWAEAVAWWMEQIRANDESFFVEVCPLDEAAMAFYDFYDDAHGAKVVMEGGLYVVAAWRKGPPIVVGRFNSARDAAVAAVVALRMIGE